MTVNPVEEYCIMGKFNKKKFILSNRYAEQLYFDHAQHMPIIDYHNHLPPSEIYQERIYNNITEAWLEGDHYKWRAMRALGIDEDLITGGAEPREKFRAWARSVPYTMRNPLYHWTHMELKTYFGINELLNEYNADEIYDQVAIIKEQAEKYYNTPLTNIVYMGMGEPLLNYKNTLASVEKITSPQGLGMSPSRITVSTAGIAKMIRKMADDGTKVNLALSLHAADDAKRNEMMPINESNNLEALHEAIQYFYQQTGNRISYEYIAFHNYNDTLQDAENLSKLCRHYPVKINIIEYNPIGLGTFEKSDEERLNRFAESLTKKGVMVTVRRSRGKDIDAACGQLANKD